VQEGSLVDPVFQLRRNRQWTYLTAQSTGGRTLRTPTTIPNLGTAASPPLISQICNDVAAAIEAVFLSTNPTATSTQMLAALVSESDRTAAVDTPEQMQLDLQRAAADVWLRRDGYINQPEEHF
jgi:hypothetical protein